MLLGVPFDVRIKTLFLYVVVIIIVLYVERNGVPWKRKSRK